MVGDRYTRGAIGAMAVLGLVACGGGGGGGHFWTGGGDNDGGVPGDADGNAPGDMARPPDLARVAYPPGPYGNLAGDTLANFTLSGYRLSPDQTDSTQLPWVSDISLEDFHANPGCKCLVISYSATWCGACQQEQGTLPGEVARDPGLCVLDIHIEGPVNGSGRVTRADVDQWTQRYQQDYPVVLGTPQQAQLWNGWGQNNTIGLPFNFIVQPDTMQVVDAIQGYDPQLHDHAMQLCGQ